MESVLLVQLLVVVVLVFRGHRTVSKTNKEAELKKVDFILRLDTNNHFRLRKRLLQRSWSGCWFELPPEESSSDGYQRKAPRCISRLAWLRTGKSRITAAIVEHTSGISNWYQELKITGSHTEWPNQLKCWKLRICGDFEKKKSTK